MRSRTTSVVVAAPKAQVFSYLADIRNLPTWATEFCRTLTVVDGQYKIATCPAMGSVEMFFQIRADEKTGVIDMFAGPTEDQMGLFPTRVVELPDGLSVFLFTMFQVPGISDEQFQGQYDSLQRELANIARRFSS